MKVGREFLQSVEKDLSLFLASSDVVCSCPQGMMRLTDDEDGSSSEGSSLSDSYVEAPLENAQVGGGDPP